MHIFKQVDEWLEFRKTLAPDLSLGFVPTMGNLHRGHASLFLESAKENTHTVSSLFINPTQFDKADDFEHYPRSLDADLALMADSGVSFCLLPDAATLYADLYVYKIQEDKLSLLMEGQHRPGHFNGVLTVVMKLLNMTRPTRAYFGEKDYQQYLLIQQMAQAFFMNVEIKVCPTVREQSMLAYSSRNNRLNAEQKLRAITFAALFHQYNKSCATIAEELKANHINVDYVEEHQGRRFAAVLIDAIRLIDNYALIQTS